MWPSPFPVRITRISVFKFILLVLLIILSVVLCTGADISIGPLSSPESNLSNSSHANESLDQSAYDVHVYVSNKDNERLKVSLFIDSELKDTKELSSDSELKINSYPLPRGPHSFKITWWDEDVKKSYEMEELKEILGVTSVNLYTSLHDAPEKFDVSVKLTNENRNDLEAYLYVDDSFEKSKEVGKDSTSELGTIKLEEGVHNLSVKWQDKDTKVEYEKIRKITVMRDDAVVFYAPQGISFEAKQSALQSEKMAYSGANKETASSAKENAIEKSSLTNETSIKDEASSTNEIASKSITKAEPRTNNLRKSASYASESRPLTGDALKDSDKIYLYAILVIVAVYLILRR
jgi:flagellar hook-associated protein FlgK